MMTMRRRRADRPVDPRRWDRAGRWNRVRRQTSERKGRREWVRGEEKREGLSGDDDHSLAIGSAANGEQGQTATAPLSLSAQSPAVRLAAPPSRLCTSPLQSIHRTIAMHDSMHGKAHTHPHALLRCLSVRPSACRLRLRLRRISSPPRFAPLRVHHRARFLWHPVLLPPVSILFA